MDLEAHAFEVLQKAGIKRGKTVLDFGCGSGTYTIPAAKIVGEEGKIYALDKDIEKGKVPNFRKRIFLRKDAQIQHQLEHHARV